MKTEFRVILNRAFAVGDVVLLCVSPDTMEITEDDRPAIILADTTREELMAEYADVELYKQLVAAGGPPPQPDADNHYYLMSYDIPEGTLVPHLCTRCGARAVVRYEDGTYACPQTTLINTLTGDHGMPMELDAMKPYVKPVAIPEEAAVTAETA